MENKLTWIGIDKQKPEDKQKCIVNNMVGLYWGVYSKFKLGFFIEGRESDFSENDETYGWIPYPEDEVIINKRK